MDFLKIWKKFTNCNVLPNCAIITIYEKYHGRLGIHQDKDENDFSFPILFFSLVIVLFLITEKQNKV